MGQPATMPSVSLSINGVALSKTAKVLGVSMDDHTKFYSFINKKVQTCNYHLRNLRSIKKSLNFSTRVLLVTNLIMSTADYCNILLLPATSADLKPLRLVMNKAVRFIYDLRIRTHITPFYKKLHLLPIHIRIKFKACLLAYKCYYKLSPTYLHDEFETFVVREMMKSREGTGRDEFMFSESKEDMKKNHLILRIKREWNSLPLNIRKSSSVEIFKTRLKTLLFTKY